MFVLITALLFSFTMARVLQSCPTEVPVTCPTLSTPPPATSVTKLRPGNIKAVMSIGDSMTAGFAMIGEPPLDIKEDRNYVFSIGGASDAFSLATMLANYNPNVQGAAQFWTLPLTEGDWLDGGVSMARVEQTLSQVDYLVNQLQTTYSSTVDFENDWKLLTVLIGANNACGACQGVPWADPLFFKKNLKILLDTIHQKIPRVFVNLVTLFNISGVYYAGVNDTYCEIIHHLWHDECPCVETGKIKDLAIMDRYTVKYNQASQALADYYYGLNDPNFTVVVQPGLSGMYLPNFPDPLAYLSNLDCFHPSLCANLVFTYQIWNNMMTPQGSKATDVDLSNMVLKCPDDNTFIQ